MSHPLTTPYPTPDPNPILYHTPDPLRSPPPASDNLFANHTVRSPEPRNPDRTTAASVFGSQTFPGTRATSSTTLYETTPTPPPYSTVAKPDSDNRAATPLSAHQQRDTQGESGDRSSPPPLQSPVNNRRTPPATTPSPAATPPAPRPSRYSVWHQLPKKWLWVRIGQAFASAASFAFQIGASPATGGEPIPMSDVSDFYFVSVVACISVTADVYFICVYYTRMFFTWWPVIVTVFDLLLAAFWGIGLVLSVVKFRCPVSGYNHWCDVFNVSLFFGYIAFVLFLITLGWDFYTTIRSCCGSPTTNTSPLANPFQREPPISGNCTCGIMLVYKRVTDWRAENRGRYYWACDTATYDVTGTRTVGCDYILWARDPVPVPGATAVPFCNCPVLCDVVRDTTISKRRGEQYVFVCPLVKPNGTTGCRFLQRAPSPRAVEDMENR